MALKHYKVSIPECNLMTFIHSVNPKKAIKEAAKIEFERRGRQFFKFDGKEFVNATAFANYIESHGFLDKICQESKMSV